MEAQDALKCNFWHSWDVSSKLLKMLSWMLWCRNYKRGVSAVPSDEMSHFSINQISFELSLSMWIRQPAILSQCLTMDCMKKTMKSACQASENERRPHDAVFDSFCDCGKLLLSLLTKPSQVNPSKRKHKNFLDIANVLLRRKCLNRWESQIASEWWHSETPCWTSPTWSHSMFAIGWAQASFSTKCFQSHWRPWHWTKRSFKRMHHINQTHWCGSWQAIQGLHEASLGVSDNKLDGGKPC